MSCPVPLPRFFRGASSNKDDVTASRLCDMKAFHPEKVQLALVGLISSDEPFIRDKTLHGFEIGACHGPRTVTLKWEGPVWGKKHL